MVGNATNYIGVGEGLGAGGKVDYEVLNYLKYLAKYRKSS